MKNKILSIEDGIVNIQVTNGNEVFTIDEEDLEKVSEVGSWSLNSKGRVVGRYQGKLWYLHRFLLDDPPQRNDQGKKLVIDHKNRDPLDNTKENLRVITNQENMFNTDAKGYCFHKARGKFMARIMINGNLKYLGYFNNPQDAHKAYLKAKKKYHKITEGCNET